MFLANFQNAEFNRHVLRLGLDKLGRKRLLRMLKDPTTKGGLRKAITKQIRAIDSPTIHSIDAANLKDISDLIKQYKQVERKRITVNQNNPVFENLSPDNTQQGKRLLEDLAYTLKYEPEVLDKGKVLVARNKQGKPLGITFLEPGYQDTRPYRGIDSRRFVEVSTLVGSPYSMLKGGFGKEKGVGKQLLLASSLISRDLGRKGRLVLLPTPNAESWYARQGFQKIRNSNYLVLSPQEAKKLVS